MNKYRISEQETYHTDKVLLLAACGSLNAPNFQNAPKNLQY
jgi:hypothetical protein